MSDFDRMRAAEMLQSNPLFNLIMHEAKVDAVETWKRSDNPAQRETQWMRHKALEEIELRIQKILDDNRLEGERRRRAERREAAAR